MNKKLAFIVTALCMALSMLVSCASPASSGNRLKINKKFHTNLTGLSTEGGTWNVTGDGLHSSAVDMGDCFVYSATSAENFVYSADVKFLVDDGAASLIFNNASTSSHDECYAVNLDAGSKMAKYWRWTDLGDEQLINEKEAPAADASTRSVIFMRWTAAGVSSRMRSMPIMTA